MTDYTNGRGASTSANGHDPELATLGSLLLDNGVLPDVRRMLGAEDFEEPVHRRIYGVILAMDDRGEPIDATTLPGAIEAVKVGLFRELGGDEYLARILGSTPHACNARHYADIVRQKAQRRALVDAGAAFFDAVRRGDVAVEDALADAERRLGEIRLRAGGVAGPFSLEMVSSADLFADDDPVEWFIDDVMAQGEPSGIAGPSKSLKTSLLIDKAISLATATKFLGRFAVPVSRRVGLISGESGKRIITSTARQVCKSRDISPDDLGEMYWGFKLPQLSNAEHLRVLRKTIEDNGLEYLAVDPLYLSLLAGNSGVDAKDMFQMGPLLLDVSALCLEAGCTPDLAHHFTKKRDDPFSPPELSEAAYAGYGQAIGQWMLVAPRERFDAEIGLFKLHFTYGGRSGFCGSFAVDIEVGKLTKEVDTRKWVVTIQSPSEERAARQERRQEDAVRKLDEKRGQAEAARNREECDLVVKAVEALKAEPGRKATARRLRLLLGCGADKADRIVVRMEKAGMVVPVDDVPVSTGMGRSKDAPGYRLSDDPDTIL